MNALSHNLGLYTLLSYNYIWDLKLGSYGHIYISTNYYSLDSLDPLTSLDSFVTENPYPSFNRDNPLSEDFKIHRITSKSSDNTTYSTTKERRNADTIRSQLDTGADVSSQTLSIFFINTDHTHPGVGSLTDFHKCLTLVKLLLQRVKDISEWHILP